MNSSRNSATARPFLPPADNPTTTDAWPWYLNIKWELAQTHITDAQKQKITGYYEEAGLLRAWRQPFFRAHYSDSFTRATRYLFSTKGPRRILDLGCGCGTQALYFACMGFEVEAIDADAEALAILDKRVDLYSRKLGHKLHVRTHFANTLSFDYSEIGPFGGIYSMFAFNMMQPTDELIDRMLPGCSPDVRIAIIDGNNTSWLPRVFPSRRREVKTPAELALSLVQRGFKIQEHDGAIAVPPLLWFAAGSIAASLDRKLRKSPMFSISHQILAERTAEGRQGPVS